MTQKKKKKKAKKLYDSANADQRYVLESLFPELKESEEDKNKRIIKDIKYILAKERFQKEVETPYIEMLAWLEKQGEQQLNGTFINADDVREDFIQEVYRVLDADSTNDRANQIIDAFDNLPTVVYSNQGEQKPADKAEPKFKVGDWVIVDDGRTGRIIECTKDFADVDLEFSCLSTRVNNIRSWTIQDAKDGDLIYVGTEEKGIQAIFHEYKNKTIFFHCYLCFDFAQGGYMPIGDVELVYPLQKTHYKRFFEKMHEKGFEWDADKKELKKIEQKSDDLPKGEDYGIDGLYAAVDILKKTLGKVDGYQTDDGILEHECAISAVKSLYEQKPTWSEEDKKMLKKSIKLFNEFGGDRESGAYTLQEMDCRNCADWLKSLKDRVGCEANCTTTKEWSEEDESHIRYLIECLEHCKKGVALTMTTSTAQEYIDWLKSLRPQNTWKPSDEQIKALNYVVNLMASSESPKENDYYYNVFKDLREQLKNLKR